MWWRVWGGEGALRFAVFEDLVICIYIYTEHGLLRAIYPLSYFEGGWVNSSLTKAIWAGWVTPAA